MALFLLQSSDDSAAAATLILHAGDMVDDLVRAVQDLDGEVHALVTTTGVHNLVGIVELPDAEAAVALTLLQRSRGRRAELVPAVAVGRFGDVIERINRVLTTSPGDDRAPADGEVVDAQGDGAGDAGRAEPVPDDAAR
ncbi:MAG TPA: GYD domain-containing protein [Jiangellaceae bacterium]